MKCIAGLSVMSRLGPDQIFQSPIENICFVYVLVFIPLASAYISLVLVLTLSGTPAACCKTKRIHRASAKKQQKKKFQLGLSIERPLPSTGPSLLHTVQEVHACVCHVTKKKKKVFASMATTTTAAQTSQPNTTLLMSR